MDQSALVKDRVYDGRRFVERFAADGNPVQAAFWVQTAEEGIWFLYIVTDIIDRLGPAAAYRAVHASAQRLGESSIASSEVKVISPNNPIATDVLATMARQPSRSASRLIGQTLGMMDIEQAYVYPPEYFTSGQPVSMTTEDVGREIVRLLNRGPGMLRPSHIVLKDGTSFNGVPFSIQTGSQNAVMAHFIEDGETGPRVVRLDQIASIA